MSKKCSLCLESKAVEAFGLDRTAKSGRSSRCLDCRKRTRNKKYLRDYHKAGRVADPRRWMNNRLRAMYKITLEQYEEILEAQGGVCAICLKPETHRNPDGKVSRLSVDHDHSCCPGKTCCGECVRGLVCRRCNAALGMIEDSIETAGRLIDYLTRSHTG
jgi:hypothetical protein